MTLVFRCECALIGFTGPAAPSSGLDETSDADADGSPEPIEGTDPAETEIVDATAAT